MAYKFRRMDCDFSLVTSNRFAPLSQDDPSAPTGTLKLPKPDKPEHFIVLKEKITQLANIPSLVGLYNWKRLRNGDLKIFSASTEAAAVIKAEVDKLGWYSHPTSERIQVRGLWSSAHITSGTHRQNQHCCCWPSPGQTRNQNDDQVAAIPRPVQLFGVLWPKPNPRRSERSYK